MNPSEVVSGVMPKPMTLKTLQFHTHINSKKNSKNIDSTKLRRRKVAMRRPTTTAGTVETTTSTTGKPTKRSYLVW